MARVARQTGEVSVSFTEEDVCSLAGLSRRQLRYWADTDFFSPNVEFGSLRLYSFRDLVGLRVIAMLREKKIPLQQLRRVGAWLHENHSTPWASLRFAVGGRTVYFRDPQTGAFVTARGGGQTAIDVALDEVAADMSERLRRRRDKSSGRIDRSRSVARNAPRLAGTRVPTAAIWNFVQEGYTHAQILSEYPHLTEKDVKAAIAHENERRHAKKKQSA